MSDGAQIRFPCEHLPETPAQARLLGVYPQRAAEGEKLFMQRVKVPGGRLRTSQLRGLAEIAARYAPDYPLHVTTRQNVELHGVRGEDVPAVQQRIAALGLTGAAACGDTVRNIVVCPCTGCCAGTWNVDGVASAIRATVENLPWTNSLPRKFKISVSGCDAACGRPWLNDVGLVANEDGGFRAILGGSLGPKPGLGIQAYDALPCRDVLPLLVAVLRLFHAEGERTNRGRARLRHLRQRLGDELFLGRVAELLAAEQEEDNWPELPMTRVERDVPSRIRLALLLGDIGSDLAIELAAAVEAVRGEIRLGLSHDLFLLGELPPALSPRLTALADGRSVIACPGSTWCSRGMVDCRTVATHIISLMPSGGSLLVGITGCPNNCAQAVAMDIGLVGRLLSGAGQARKEGFRLFAGGGRGETPKLAEELHPALPAEVVPAAVAWVAEEYQRNDSSWSSFTDFVVASASRLREELIRQYPPPHSGSNERQTRHSADGPQPSEVKSQ